MEPIMGSRRVARACSNLLPKPGQADTRLPDKDAANQPPQVLHTGTKRRSDSAPTDTKQENPGGSAPSVCVKLQEQTLQFEFSRDGVSDGSPSGGQKQDGNQNKNTSDGLHMDNINKNSGRGGPSSVSTIPDLDNIDFWEPSPPKVLMKNPADVPLELRSQIQHYATTE